MSEERDFVDLQREAQLIADARMIGVGAQGFRAQVEELWDKGLPRGSLTGWPSLDKHYTVAPGHLTIVTGWPGSGKSEFIDALLMNLARQGWRFALHSPENRPEQIHVVKYLEKLLGKPFGAGPNERMTKEEAAEAMTEITDWFGFLVAAAASEQTVFNIEQILAAAEHWFISKGYWRSKENPRGLVIDPWNELEHHRPKDRSETEYISATLTALRSWARTHAVHVWVVAHPQKLKRDDGGKLPIPRPDSISGSQHWWNKADNALTVWREPDDQYATATAVDIHIQKVRFKHIGSTGLVTLHYDRVTGRYHEQPQHMRAVK